jgi:hypothetical protein
MSLSWWQGLVNRGKLKLKSSSARRLRRRRTESRRNLFEPLEPRVLLTAANPKISASNGLSTAFVGAQGDLVQIPIRLDSLGVDADLNQGLDGATVRVTFNSTYFHYSSTTKINNSSDPDAPTVVAGPLMSQLESNGWTFTPSFKRDIRHDHDLDGRE